MEIANARALLAMDRAEKLARPDKYGLYWTDREGVAIDRIA